MHPDSHLIPDTPEANFAQRVLRSCCSLASKIQAQLSSIEALNKEDRSPVTLADFAVQAVVTASLAQEFPRDPLVAEEGVEELQNQVAAPILGRVSDFVTGEIGPTSKDEILGLLARGSAEASGRFWTLDPIDGTKGFLRGDQYAIALALIEGQRVVLGGLGCPSLSLQSDQEEPGIILLAKRGAGTWLIHHSSDGGSRLRVSERRDPKDARILRSVERAHTNLDQIDQVSQSLGTFAQPVGVDSQAKYAILAAGQVELLFRLLSPKNPDYKEKIWDQAAGSIIVEEAGGRVTDLSGRALDFGHGRTLLNNSGVVASNGHLHDSALEALRTTNL